MFLAVAALHGWEHGCDLLAVQGAADGVPRPVADRHSLTLGYAGVPAAFLRSARAAADRHGADLRAVLIEAGRRRLVAGQEEMLVDVALDLGR